MTEGSAERDPTLEHLEGFSNAVFAIAITLLVFELVVPHLTGTISSTRLWRALARAEALKETAPGDRGDGAHD